MHIRMFKTLSYCAGLLMLIVSMTSGVLAGGTPVPEIDGASMATGLGLLSAGILIVRARLGR